MKKYISLVVICLVIVYLIPLFIYMSKKEEKIYFLKKDEKINVLNTQTNKIQQMFLDEYVLNVLSKEMPASFEDEALKAQSVAIRTYALRKKETQNNEHEDADVCTDSTHCMAYDFDGPEEKYKEKLQRIVAETKGETLVYDGEYASTVFHALSSGNTENSKDVWGGDVPYLISVKSEEDKNVEGYETKVTVSYNEFINKLNAKDFEKVIGEIKRTETGSVKTIVLCGREYTGAKVRQLFNLRSSNFKLEENDDGYVFTVYGYGHGVGMSQYGANNYAKAGYTYKDILNHYYPGTELKNTAK